MPSNANITFFMVNILQFGNGCYLIAILLQSLLTLRQRKLSAFMAYCYWLLVGNAAMFVVYNACDIHVYAKFFWLYFLIDNVFAASAIGEIYGYESLGFWIGFLASLCCLPLGFHMWIMQLCTFLLATAAFMTFFVKADRYRAAGFLVMFLFPAIIYDVHAVQWMAYVPVFAWMLAVIVWLYGDVTRNVRML